MAFCLQVLGCGDQGDDESVTSVCFAGDIMLDRGVRGQIGLLGADSLFSDIGPILSSADFSVANLECPVTEHVDPQDKRYVFRADPKWLPALRRAGLSHLVLANNHALDQGIEGLQRTIQNLGSSRVVPVGAALESADACAPALAEKDGGRLALFAAVQVGIEDRGATPGRAGICRATTEELVHRIRTHRRDHSGTRIIVSLHWGVEYSDVPSLNQEADARALIDAGADAIIGHHPHVLQPIEVYRNRPTFYSLGNLVFDQRQPAARESMIVCLKFSGAGIKSADVYPLVLEDCVPRWVGSVKGDGPRIEVPESGTVEFRVRYRGSGHRG